MEKILGSQVQPIDEKSEIEDDEYGSEGSPQNNLQE